MDDSALAAAIADRKPEGLDGAYRRYADPLFAYARTLIGDRDAAADIVQDTFLLAGEHIAQLRDPGRLRPWLYAIARNEGLRHLRRRSRHAPLESAPESVRDLPDPGSSVHSTEATELVRAAMAGMSEGDREIAELALRHELSITDVAAVLGVRVNNARARMSRAREQLLVSLGVLLVARHGDCPDLAQRIEGWDGVLTPLLRKRLHRHIESCERCTGVKRDRLNPAALLTAYTALPFPAVVDLRRVSGSPVPPRWARTGFPAAAGRSLPAVAAAVVVLILVAGGATWLAVRPHPEPAPLPQVASEVPSPTHAPSPTPSPSATSTHAAPASPTPRDSASGPVAPTPAATTPAAFTFGATASCTTDAAGWFTLTVTLTANRPLGRATLTYYGPTQTTVRMAVSGRFARGSGTGTSSVPVRWRVEASATGGQVLRGSWQTTQCM